MAVGGECALVSAPGFKPGGGRYGRLRWVRFPHVSAIFLYFAVVERREVFAMEESPFKLKGFSYPLCPEDKASIVDPFPWPGMNNAERS